MCTYMRACFLDEDRTCLLSLCMMYSCSASSAFSRSAFSAATRLRSMLICCSCMEPSASERACYEAGCSHMRGRCYPLLYHDAARAEIAQGVHDARRARSRVKATAHLLRQRALRAGRLGGRRGLSLSGLQMRFAVGCEPRNVHCSGRPDPTPGEHEDRAHPVPSKGAHARGHPLRSAQALRPRAGRCRLTRRSHCRNAGASAPVHADALAETGGTVRPQLCFAPQLDGAASASPATSPERYVSALTHARSSARFADDVTCTKGATRTWYVRAAASAT